MNEDAVKFQTNHFGIIISNLSSDVTKHVHLYNNKMNESLIINYYKEGRFSRENYNIQTPIYDINLIYKPTNDDNRSLKIFFELLPLQKSSFSFARGRTFRIGYETPNKQLSLYGDLAFTIEDIYKKQIILMNEPWKLIYGRARRDRLVIKWNLKIDINNKTVQGQVNIQDPNNAMSIPISSTINGYLKDTSMIATVHTYYSSLEDSPKPIILELNVDQRFSTQQHVSVKLIHEFSKTNLSLSLDHYPRRKFRIRLKPNHLSHEKTFVHLYANTTASELNLVLILANLVNFNLTLPKSYPETGLLHSSLFVDNEEYFDGRLETAILKLRSKKYLCYVKLNKLLLEKKFSEQILASIYAQWIERNSTTGLITVFSKKDFKRKLIPYIQSIKQKTWLERFEEFLFANNLTLRFGNDLENFFKHIKNDFIDEHEQFGVKLAEHLELDEDFKLLSNKINNVVIVFTDVLFQIGYYGESLLQEYLNNLTILTNHQNLLHLDMSQLATLAIDTFVYDVVYYVNKTLIMFNHLTHYPRSMNAIVSYLSNEIILNTHEFINNLYLETKTFVLSKAIEYSNNVEFLLKLFPHLSDSVTYFSSTDIRKIVYIFNEKLRQLLSLWLNSPIEHKIMHTIASLLIQFSDRLRYHMDDKLDFLLPRLQVYTPRLGYNNTNNQTFLITWMKNYNLTNIIDEE